MCDQAQDKMVIGWTGTHTTMHYLNELIPVLQELEQTHVFTFLVISNEAPNFELKSLQFIKWNKETEIEAQPSLLFYLPTFIQHFHLRLDVRRHVQRRSEWNGMEG